MATVTGVTAERAEELENRLITSASRSGTSLILQTNGAGTINVPNAFPAPFEQYHVGQILMTDRSANPSTYLGGGTWVRWGKGKVPVSVDEAQVEFDGIEKVGGAKTHRLTEGEMPTHNHGGRTGNDSPDHSHDQYVTAAVGNEGGVARLDYDGDAVSGGTRFLQGAYTGGAIQRHQHDINPSGSGQEHNNLQPYITVYMWKRTA